MHRSGGRRFRGRPRGRAGEPLQSSARQQNDLSTQATPPQPPENAALQAPKDRTAFDDNANSLSERSHTPCLSQCQDHSLAVRLAREISAGTYECLICVSPIKRHHAVFSCQICYAITHLHCVSDWASRSIHASRERQSLLSSQSTSMLESAPSMLQEVVWRCPTCRAKNTPEEVPSVYRCFCGRVKDPRPSLTALPHSCAMTCQRPRPDGCTHPCRTVCHPGPCETCSAVLECACHCGKTTLSIRCSQLHPLHRYSGIATYGELLSCGKTCDKQLSCGAHKCSMPCHNGPCPSCDVEREERCYCGQSSKVGRCSEMDERSACFAPNSEEQWIGAYCCERRCPWPYACGHHVCEQQCHPHFSNQALPCPRDPAAVHRCPCGSQEISENRTSCLDPIRTCGQLCNRSLDCGHACRELCHAGPCPECAEPVIIVCRCGAEKESMTCAKTRQQMKSSHDKLCERLCRALRHCGRHPCHRKCCPLAYQYHESLNAPKRGKGKRMAVSQVASYLETVDPTGLHNCDFQCGKLLDCKIHNCQRQDHRGPCGRCLNASFDELRCPCGRTVYEPPVPCGTELQCSFPCHRSAPRCGHPKIPHPCHPDIEKCPPCPFLVSKTCPCTRAQVVRNVKCSVEHVSCGMLCERLLSCGWHTCRMLCHSKGSCDPCRQKCGKPRRFCSHPCDLTCHAPASCAQENPCDAVVECTCSCGNLKRNMRCGSCTAQPSGSAQRVLKCNDSCVIAERNLNTAHAFGLDSNTPQPALSAEWSDWLLFYYGQNSLWSKGIESTFNKLIDGERGLGKKAGHLFLPMRWEQRKFVHELAQRYQLQSESLDAEPKRSVFVRCTHTSASPSPLLSQAYLEQAEKHPAQSTISTRRTGRSSVNALLLHGGHPPVSEFTARITSCSPALHNATLCPGNIDGTTLIILSPEYASPAVLDSIRDALAFDALLGCSQVELVCIEPATRAVLWRKRPYKCWDTNPERAIINAHKPNAFAALELHTEASREGVEAAANRSDVRLPLENWEDADK